MADKGIIYAPGLEVEIKEVLRPVEGLNVHLCSISSGTLNINNSVQVEVEANRRKNIARNHSATHLLHKALKEVLGNHANQAGSLVEPDRLRFDFTHFSALSQEEIVQIEKIVNQAIMADLPVETFETSMDEAKSLGAAALFGEKYGDRVRVIKMGEFSIELCGGTHLNSTAQIGMFKLQSEGSVGSGIRRIEAITGEGALRYVESREQQLTSIATILKTSPSELVSRVGMLVKEHRELERELETLRARLAKFEVESLLNNSVDVEDVKVLAEQANAGDMDSLRAMVDLLRDKMGSGVIVLGTSSDQQKVNLVAGVSKDLTAKGLHAGKIIKEIASVVGGGGGGRPDMAQAGGKDPSRLQEALDKVASIVKQQLG